MIAEAAGVSRATVSLALRGNPAIREATRRRVRRVADRLGYRPHPAVANYIDYVQHRRLQGRYRATLAMLLTEPVCRAADVSVQRELYDGAVARATELGYVVEDFLIGGARGLSVRRLREVLVARGIDGVIVSEGQPAAHGAEVFDWRGLCAVTFGYTLRTPSLSRACSNHFMIVTRLLGRLEARGYRRVGLVCSEAANERGYRIAKSACLGFQSGLPDERVVPYLQYKDWSDGEFLAWFERHRPDAIISHDGQRILRSLRASGVRVPEEVGVASYMRMADQRGMCGYSQNFPAVGAAAVDLLAGQLQRNERGAPACPKLVLVDGIWHDGVTLRDCADE
jgi:LacI family transcriptional regulator